MIKYIISCVLISILFPIGAMCQLSEGGSPPSFSYSSVLRSVESIYNVPVDIDINQLLFEDELEKKDGLPPRFAVVIPVDIDMRNSGTWTNLPGAKRIWRQTITAKGATGLILSYKDFFIPKGGKLYIYNTDRSQILGAYTNETHPEGGKFSTEIIYDESLTLEYVEPVFSDISPRIVIEDIGYVYPKLSSLRAAMSRELPINTSWPCMINVNCEEGRNWQAQKRGVVCILIKFTSARWGHCTGSLINNTARDGTPYILTAAHNIENAYGAQDQMIFYFNYEFPSCADEQIIPVTTRSLVGTQILVNVPLLNGSDGALLKIKGVTEVPREWNPYYNGWDISDTPSPYGAVLHHPAGDVKKITSYKKLIESATYTWAGGMYNAYWEVAFDGKSVTQSASSGAPLFSERGLIIGTLTGGYDSTCENPTFGPEYFGKMTYHWDKYVPESGQAQQKMKPYLDPLGKNVLTLSGHDPNSPTGIAPGNKEQDLILFTDQNNLNINAVTIIRKIDIYSLTGSRIYSAQDLSSSTLSLPVSDWTNGVYYVIINTNNGISTGKFYKR